MNKCIIAVSIFLIAFFIADSPIPAFAEDAAAPPAATEAAHEEEGGESHVNLLLLLWIPLILIVAKKAGRLMERFGQPPVLGELLAGIALGNLSLLGLVMFEPPSGNETLAFLAELGVIILLFQIGLESNIEKLKKVGLRALLVACAGVVAPFVLGTFVAGPYLLPGLEFNQYLFLGASLTATSVGITARVFKDLNRLQTSEAQIVLGAAVIDDVLGLIILAVVSAIVTMGAVSLGMIGWITAKAVIFLLGGVIAGQYLARILGKFFAKIDDSMGMKFTLAASFALVFGYLASAIGLAPIVGAFAAGLLLDKVHFRYFRDPLISQDIAKVVEKSPSDVKQKVSHVLREHGDRHVEELIQPLGYFFVPLFFVTTGMAVKLDTLFDPSILLVALLITAAAFAGKLVSGLAAGNVDKWLVGLGMAPRGEVGLIFATIGRGLGVVNEEMFSIIIIMVILTTLLTPPVISWRMKRSEHVPKEGESDLALAHSK